MQIFIKLFKGCLTYTTKSEHDTIIMLKRYIADQINMEEKWGIYSMSIHYAGKILNDRDKISDKLVNESTVHVFVRYGCGPESSYQELTNVYISNDQIISVSYSLNSQIKFLLEQVVETLVANKNLSNKVLIDDYHLTLGGKILSPYSLVAEYPELSASFVAFNKQDEIVDTLSEVGIPVDKDGDYYQMVPLGFRVHSDKKLKFHIGKPSSEIYNNNNCLPCQRPYYIVMPCCRNKACMSCFGNCLIGELKCPCCLK